MKNISTIKLTLYLLVFIGIAGFSVFPKSYTKFTESKPSYLKYKANMISLNKNETVLPINLVSYSDDRSTAMLEFDLPKNNSNLGDRKNDVYSITVPKKCNVVNVNKEEINFEDQEDIKKISLTCDIGNSSDLVHKDGESSYLEFSVQVNEKINNDIVPFRYKDYSYKEDLPVSSTLKMSNEEEVVDNSKLEYFQGKIKEIILAKPKYQPYATEVTSYLDTADFSNGKFELSGMKVEYDSVTDKFYYEIEESFLGRARTYHANKSLEVKNTMVFSTDNREMLENEFEYYLNEYYSKDTDKNNLIINYIRSNNGISSVLLDGENILGITKVSNNTIELDSNIMDYVSKMYGDTFVNIYNNDGEEIQETFKAAVNKISNISSSLREKIKSDVDIQNELNKDYDISNLTPSYFIVNDKDDYILIQISSKEKFKKVLFTKILLTRGQDENISVSLVYLNENKPSLEEQKKLMQIILDKFQCTALENTLLENVKENDVTISFDMLKKKSETVDDNNLNTNLDSDNSNVSNSSVDGVRDAQKEDDKLQTSSENKILDYISNEAVAFDESAGEEELAEPSG